MQGEDLPSDVWPGRRTPQFAVAESRRSPPTPRFISITGGVLDGLALKRLSLVIGRAPPSAPTVPAKTTMMDCITVRPI